MVVVMVLRMDCLKLVTPYAVVRVHVLRHFCRGGYRGSRAVARLMLLLLLEYGRVSALGAEALAHLLVLGDVRSELG